MLDKINGGKVTCNACLSLAKFVALPISHFEFMFTSFSKRV